MTTTTGDMAWGYWTAYAAPYARQAQQQRTLSPPNKRDRSVERERDRVAAAAADCVSRTSFTNDTLHKPHVAASNHVEPEKVAYERRLLLGDPDWSNRTIADRNTLPRKKQPEYDKSSGSEALYAPKGNPSQRHSPAVTPLDSGSRKSDDVFCPACAHHSATSQSNRDSRVSFGSIASSSRGSRGSSARGGAPPPPGHSVPPLRARSRSQDDDDRCSSRGGLSSSLPTPPPPPFSSQRDILAANAAANYRGRPSTLMETINQKMSILSTFKPIQQPTSHHGNHKYNTMGNSSGGGSGRSSVGYHPDTMPTRHRRGGGEEDGYRGGSYNYRGNHHPSTGARKPLEKTASREHSSSSLHSLRDASSRGSSSHRCDSNNASSSAKNAHQRSYSAGRRASRSGSRTPRGSSSRTSRESLGRTSRESMGSRERHNRRSSSEPLDPEGDGDGDGEESDGNNDVQQERCAVHVEPRGRHEKGSVIGIRDKKSNSVDEITCGDATIHREDVDSQSDSQRNYGPQSNDGDDDDDEEDEDNRGTMRRKPQRLEAPMRSALIRLSSEDISRKPAEESAVSAPSSQSLRSSQSQTPDEEPDLNVKKFGRQAVKKSSLRKTNGTPDKDVVGSSYGRQVVLPPPQSYNSVHYFKHYDHRDMDTRPPIPRKPFDFSALTATAPSKRRDYTDGGGNAGSGGGYDGIKNRRRSASIGDRLSDIEPEHEYCFQQISGRRNVPNSVHHGPEKRRHATAQRNSPPRHHQRLASMTSFHTMVSSPSRPGPSATSSTKSEKSSSRSSQSPSVEGARYGSYPKSSFKVVTRR